MSGHSFGLAVYVHSLRQFYGKTVDFIFGNAKVVFQSWGSGAAATYLWRPWKEYSRTVYVQTMIDGVVDGAGWRPWDRDFALTTLYYAEFNNSGVGSSIANRVTWQDYHVINATDAANFTVSNFLLGDNWLPKTGVAYTNAFI
ncbi:probable pectinesterase/pectinesterase inhibitor 7 [Arachis hypogaea]|uniref:Pectinesterase catalytic domain-containing protein n=1 Tax=Arachis hypogaea TaxID=3818 RepID=A0A444YIE2_ARAHY|nr:putative pectinesterase/pectinesterase inhibitor [Arachis hypogaea]RYR01706.1 hypothetical protein Ahy_B06g080569 [Arachis hypogaea]